DRPVSRWVGSFHFRRSASRRSSPCRSFFHALAASHAARRFPIGGSPDRATFIRTKRALPRARRRGFRDRLIMRAVALRNGKVVAIFLSRDQLRVIKISRMGSARFFARLSQGREGAGKAARRSLIRLLRI